MKHLSLAVFLFIGLSTTVLAEEHSNTISLSGTWQVTLDKEDRGIGERWYGQKGTDMIPLPGTLCDAGYGTPLALEPDVNNRQVMLNLQRKFDYVGPAWYKRSIEIPENWSKKRVFLELERVLWTSELWLNQKKVDQVNESLVTPHRFEITSFLKPGINEIALRIDNRYRYDVSTRFMAHAYTNETQTLWNGVLGRIELVAKDEVSIGTVTIFPNVAEEKIKVQIALDYADEPFPKGKIRFAVQGKDAGFPEVKFDLGNYASIMFDYDMKGAVQWDEFQPHLYTATAVFESEGTVDRRETVFGMRKITDNDAKLQINGRPLFLRGTLECCIFPLKGYPPTDKESWRQLLTAAKNYGLNHLRFHSWCPPKAAFEAADEIGFYFQVESPYWQHTFGEDGPTARFVEAECHRIQKEYGNHPSFCFFSVGNEIVGNYNWLDRIILDMKSKDGRRLYTNTSQSFQKPTSEWPTPNLDYWITRRTRKGWVRGQGVFDQQTIDFTQDYSASVKGLPAPLVTHEIGQYSVYPNLREIDKYTGNLVPLNFLAVKKDLEQKNLLDRADTFLANTGKFAAILYKEEIERALKTPGLCGFQLLDLHDFPGQGTALVGLLDAFWDSKGAISGDDFRRFCDPVVPLARFAKAVYRTDENLDITFEVANFGNKELRSALSWQIEDAKGQAIQKGTFTEQLIPLGGGNIVGKVSVPLDTVKEPTKGTIRLLIDNVKCENDWPVWVYPKSVPVLATSVLRTDSLEEAIRALDLGKKVLFNPPITKTQGISGRFTPVFWSPIHFPTQEGTMGILCDPKHPALAHFPTDSHAHWQWQDLCKRSTTLVIDETSWTPIVEMMDNYLKNRRLANIVEAKVGRGTLIVCAVDVTNNLETCPQAEWLRYSLLRYMESNAFAPKNEVGPNTVRALMKP